jgi:hypothetical protein
MIVVKRPRDGRRPEAGERDESGFVEIAGAVMSQDPSPKLQRNPKLRITKMDQLT